MKRLINTLSGNLGKTPYKLGTSNPGLFLKRFAFINSVVFFPSLSIVYILAESNPALESLETNNFLSLSHLKLVIDVPAVVPESTFGSIVDRSVTTRTLSVAIIS